MTQISLILINLSVEKLLLVHPLCWDIVTVRCILSNKAPRSIVMLMVIAYCPVRITRVVKQEKISRLSDYLYVVLYLVLSHCVAALSSHESKSICFSLQNIKDFLLSYPLHVSLA